MIPSRFIKHRILVHESGEAQLKRDHELLESVNCEVDFVRRPDEFVARLDDWRYDLALVAAGGEERDKANELCSYVRDFAGGLAPPVFLVLPPHEPDPIDHAKELRADGFLVRPLRSEAVQAALFQAECIREQRWRVGELDRRIKELEARMKGMGQLDPRTNFYIFDFFKRILFIEIKRSQRYGYPVAVVLVSMDVLAEIGERFGREATDEVLGGASLAVSRTIRDIDFPCYYSETEFLLMLPYTKLEGARICGERLLGRLHKLAYRRNDEEIRLHASVGVAAVEGGRGMSFSRLLRDAQVALKAARLKGGDRVVCRTACGTAIEREGEEAGARAFGGEGEAEPEADEALDGAARGAAEEAFRDVSDAAPPDAVDGPQTGWDDAAGGTGDPAAWGEGVGGDDDNTVDTMTAESEILGGGRPGGGAE